MPNEKTQQAFGISELYRPASQSVEVDIVAVHGLNGDTLRTWTAKSNGVCWLSHPDFLPKFVPNARVLSWGYNANTTSLLGRTTSSDRILQHAQTLISQLHADRDLEDALDRPIIFLCHSLGGIVVKRALAYSASRTASQIAHLSSIYTCTYGILFFGTPHCGSSKAQLLGNLQRLTAMVTSKRTVQFESGLIKALKEDSETLANITDQFAPLMLNFRIYFFWEQERMNLKYTKDYIVEESSAAPMVINTERCGIPADHRTMCQFDIVTAQGFRTAVSAIKRYSQEASQVIETRRSHAVRLLSEHAKFEAMMMLQDAQTWPGPSPQNSMTGKDAMRQTWAIDSKSDSMLTDTDMQVALNPLHSAPKSSFDKNYN